MRGRLLAAILLIAASLSTARVRSRTVLASAFSRLARADLLVSTTRANRQGRSRSQRLLRLTILGAGCAVACARGTATLGGLGAALTLGTSLLLLQVCKAAGLGVDVGHLVGRLGVKVDELLSGWGGSGLVVVRSKSVEDALNTSSDPVRLIGSLGLLGSLVLRVKAVKGLEELVGNTVLLVEIQGALGSLVTDGVAVGEILGDDAGAWLLLLGDLVRVLLRVAWLVLLCSLGPGDGNLRAAELRVVEKERRLGGRLLLEHYRGILRLAGWGDLDLGDLSAEAEEP